MTRALRYDIAWRALNTKLHARVPQNRVRVFIVGVKLACKVAEMAWPPMDAWLSCSWLLIGISISDLGNLVVHHTCAELNLYFQCVHVPTVALAIVFCLQRHSCFFAGAHGWRVLRYLHSHFPTTSTLTCHHKSLFQGGCPHPQLTSRTWSPLWQVLF